MLYVLSGGAVIDASGGKTSPKSMSKPGKIGTGKRSSSVKRCITRSSGDGLIAYFALTTDDEQVRLKDHIVAVVVLGEEPDLYRCEKRFTGFSIQKGTQFSIQVPSISWCLTVGESMRVGKPSCNSRRASLGKSFRLA
jgi:hypothetical protein